MVTMSSEHYAYRILSCQTQGLQISKLYTVIYTPTPFMGNLSYLLRDKLKHMFSVEITRSRNVFHLKGFLRVTVIQYLMGQIILREELYTPPFQTTANTDGYEKLHIVHHEQMNPLKIDIKCV